VPEEAAGLALEGAAFPEGADLPVLEGAALDEADIFCSLEDPLPPVISKIPV